MRLIDADELRIAVEKSLADNPHKEGKVRANHFTEHEHFLVIISRQPTAFDKEKVIEELADELDDNVDCDTGEPCNNWVVDMQNEMIQDHIKIVQAGGVKSDTE